LDGVISGCVSTTGIEKAKAALVQRDENLVRRAKEDEERSCMISFDMYTPSWTAHNEADASPGYKLLGNKYAESTNKIPGYWDDRALFM